MRGSLFQCAVACAEGAPGPDAATPQAQFQGQLSPEGTPPGPIGAVQAAQAAQNQQVQLLVMMFLRPHLHDTDLGKQSSHLSCIMLLLWLPDVGVSVSCAAGGSAPSMDGHSLDNHGLVTILLVLATAALTLGPPSQAGGVYCTLQSTSLASASKQFLLLWCLKQSWLVQQQVSLQNPSASRAVCNAA